MQNKTTPDQETSLLNVTSAHRSPRRRAGQLDSGTNLCAPVHVSAGGRHHLGRENGIGVFDLRYRCLGVGRQHLEDGAA